MVCCARRRSGTVRHSCPHTGPVRLRLAAQMHPAASSGPFADAVSDRPSLVSARAPPSATAPESSKPVPRWLLSQNGLLCDRPQRHSASRTSSTVRTHHQPTAVGRARGHAAGRPASARSSCAEATIRPGRAAITPCKVQRPARAFRDHSRDGVGPGTAREDPGPAWRCRTPPGGRGCIRPRGYSASHRRVMSIASSA